MADRNASGTGTVRSGPTAIALFLAFARISVLSVGGGLSAWIRRTVVERHGWMDETLFLSGFALSQIAPGPNAVNLSVFVGATLGGRRGAAASLLGLMTPPFALILVLGALFGAHGVPPPVARVLSGIAAGAIGLMIATGIRMGRGGLRDRRGILLAAATAGALAFGTDLLAVIAVALPLAFLVMRRG